MNTRFFLRWFALLNTTIIIFMFVQQALAENTVPEEKITQKAVLITGASSGIGLKMTEHLASQGHFVYAGARKEADIVALNKIPNVKAIRLDVTSQNDIDQAVKIISEEGRGLYGLVNNAGVGLWGPLTEITEDDFHYLMNVNVYGPYRITKAFSPLVIKSKGRIIMTGSLFGTSTMPMMGPYAMSKHAIEAFTDTLAAEMAPYKVKVSVIEPGTYKTQIYKNTYQHTLEAYDSDETRLPEWQKDFFKKAYSLNDTYPPPDKVAEVVSQALFSKKPKRRYMVVPEKAQADSTVRAAIKKVVQLNEGHEYSLDRATLVKMLDEEMGK